MTGPITQSSGLLTENAELSTKQYSLARTTGAESKKGRIMKKNRWKRVENDEKLSLSWKNKANLRQGEIGAISLLKGDYEEFHALRRRKNKANSKPNKANLI